MTQEHDLTKEQQPAQGEPQPLADDEQTPNVASKRSFAMRLTALGFIVLTLAGQFWFVQIVIKSEPGQILKYCTLIGILIVLTGGILMVIDGLKSTFANK